MKRFTPLILIGVTIVLPRELLPAACALTIALFWCVDRSVVFRLKHASFLIMAGLLIVVQPLLVGEPDASVLVIRYSTAALKNGIAMTLRAAIVMMTFGSLMRQLKGSSVTRVWERVGLQDFPSVFSHAHTQLPRMKSSLQQLVRTDWKKNCRLLVHHPVELCARGLVGLLRPPHHPTSHSHNETYYETLTHIDINTLDARSGRGQSTRHDEDVQSRRGGSHC
ncbi:MAG: hypothetical protein HY961_22275 [Ignavibacteriae bacterium]|nr:hypothetical protein [Ignavibacteriota bacterium]